MKKLIAISVVFALVLGAAFAQPSLSGNMKVGTTLLNGQSENEVDSAKAYAGGTVIDSAHMDAKFGDADAGGLVRFYHNTGASVPGYSPIFAFVWWRPIPQVRLQMGRFADGDWGHQDLAGWGYDSESKSVGVAISQYNDQPPLSKLPADNNAWGPGFGALGMTISLYPIDGLQVNLGIPYGGSDRAGKIYSNMYLDAKFALDDIGTVMVAAQFRPGNTNRYVYSNKEVFGEEEPNSSWRGTDEAHDPMSIWLAFHLRAIEGLGVDIGAGFTLPYTTQDVEFKTDVNPLTSLSAMINVGGVGYNGLPVNTKVSAPITVGLGANYSTGDLGVKARAAFKFAGKTVTDVSRNDSIKAERDAAAKAGNSTAHFKDLPLDLNSATFYQKYTRANGDVEWVPRSGTQEKKADPFEWGLNVKPTYKLGNITVHLNLGIGMRHYAKQEVKTKKLDAYGNYVGDDANGNTVYETITFEGKPGLVFTEETFNYASPNGVYNQAAENSIMNKLEIVKADLDWFVNPYVQIPAGGGQFYAGFKLYADGTRIDARYNRNSANALEEVAGKSVMDGVTSKKYQLKWAIPIGWNFYF